jgi:predicted nucleic acid-binding protein
MSDNIFFDTNILVYSFDSSDPRKHAIASGLIIQAFEQGTGVISAQVLKEFYVTVTQKISRTMAPDRVEQLIRDFALWRVVETTVPLILRGIHIQLGNRISFWDAMIVAAAKEADCPTLYTEDLGHEAMINGIRIHNPFVLDFGDSKLT